VRDDNEYGGRRAVRNRSVGAWLASQARSVIGRAVGSAKGEVVDRNRRMTERAETTRHGARKRTIPAMLTGFGALAFLISLVASDVLAVGFTSGSGTYKVYTDRIYGQKGGLYIAKQTTQTNTIGTTVDKPVSSVGFHSARLYGLCLIAVQTLPAPIGQVSLVITGGNNVDGSYLPDDGSGNPDVNENVITASDLFLTAPTLSGHGNNISKMYLGRDASQLGNDMGLGNGLTFAGGPGDFGMYADTMDIKNLDGESYGIDLEGNIKIPKLKIQIKPGNVVPAAGTTPYSACAP